MVATIVKLIAKPLTLEQFLQMPETEPASEYIDNEITQKNMPKGRHSRLQGKLCQEINLVTEEKKIAYAFSELRCTFDNRSIVPDIAVFKWQNIPFLENGEIPDQFNLAPDWIIEILSPDQNANKVIGKILHSLQHGAQLGWFLDPSDRSILTFMPECQLILMTGGDRLPALDPVLLELTADAIFDWLKMGK